METLLQDLRFTLRSLLRRPMLSLTIVITFSLGVGANTAIFSVVRGVLLRPLPFRDVDTLVRLGESGPTGREFIATSMPNFTDWNTARSFTEMAGYWAGPEIWVGGEFPERIAMARVTANYFSLVGLNPILGRTFLPQEFTTDAPVAILTHHFWARALGADSGVVGKQLALDGGSRTIVGVMGPDVGPSGTAPFHGALLTPRAEVVKPVWRRSARFLNVIARLRPGVTFEEARAEMGRMGADLNALYPDANPRAQIRVLPVTEALMGTARTSILLLWAAVGSVLLITCLNIASLLLVRAAGRSEEFTLRRALGASRKRLLKLAFTETLVLATLGGALGVGFGWLIQTLFVNLVPAGVPRMDEVRLDAIVLLFAAAITLVSAGLFGLAPAASVFRTRSPMPSNTRGGGGSRTSSFLRWVVGTEVAVALVLVFGSSIFLETFIALTSVDPGYDPSLSVTGRVSLPASRFREPEKKVQFYRQIEERVSALPGVEAVSTAVLAVPTRSGFGVGIGVDGALDQTRGDVFRVGPGFFEVHRITLTSGRLFDTNDGVHAPRVAIVSEATARSLFGDESALGRSVRLTTHLSLADEPRHIVGVVQDARLYGPESPVPTTVYMPLDQWASGGVYITARVVSDPASFVGPLREAIHAVDPLLPVGNLGTLEQTLSTRYASPRFYTVLLSSFAAVALLLMAAGVFGVLSTTIEQRLREVGVRIALGASRVDVVGWAIRIGMIPSLVGIALGLAGSIGLKRILNSRVAELEVADPAMFSLGSVIVIGVTLCACLLAARRVAVLEPVSVLRAE